MDSILTTLLSPADYEEIGYALLSLNNSVLDFAGSSGKPKQCSKGYSCKSTCISKDRECSNPLQGQAKNYAGWLQLQIAAGAKLSPSQQADAQAQGLTAQPAKAATPATKTAKAKKPKVVTAPPAPPPRTRTATDDLADALAKGDFKAVLDHASDIYERAKTLGGSDFYAGVQKGAGGGSGTGRSPDYLLATLWADKGYDGKPEVVTKSDLDKHIAAGETVMFRAIGSDASRFKVHFDNFKNGDYFAGKGIYGNGTYVGFSTKSVTSQRSAYDAAYGYGKGMMRMTLQKGSAIVKQTDVAKEAEAAKKDLKNWVSAERSRILTTAAPVTNTKMTPAQYKKAVKQVKDDLDAQGYDLKPTISALSKGFLVQQAVLYPKILGAVKGGRPPIIRLGDVMKNGSNDFTATTHKGDFLGFFDTAAKARKALMDKYLGDEVDKQTQNAPATRQALKDLDDKHRRAEAVLFGDEGGSMSGAGNGVSGRFATIKGYDAIKLNDSYNKNYMVLLNRSKTRVQDTDNMGNRP